MKINKREIILKSINKNANEIFEESIGIKRNLNEIHIKYKIFKKEKNLKIFDDTFVRNNIDKCTIIYEGREYKLMSYINITNNMREKKIITVKLKGIKNIVEATSMFEGCSSLKEVLDISQWNIDNITNMSLMFAKCSLIKELPDISKWNTTNINDMSCLFLKCSKLKKLPDISKWNTNRNKYKFNVF